MELRRRGRHAPGLALAACLVASCATVTGGAGGSGFEARYAAARSDLESRDYDGAIRGFRAMLDTAGPLESRLRLELAHALLRADRYAEASNEARIVAAAHEDNRRAAALAVVGTSEHRLAQEAMSRNDFGPATIAHLRLAKEAFDGMAPYSDELDPLGSMAERRAMVAASLKNLGAG